VACDAADLLPHDAVRADPQWWYNFTYRVNQARGHEAAEDLWAPGTFRAGSVRPAASCCRPASASTSSRRGLLVNADAVKADLAEHQSEMIRAAQTESRMRRSCPWRLTVHRHTRRSGRRANLDCCRVSWFADWGRDAFIALPDCCWQPAICEARSVLNTFAAAADQGMIPNLFDDHTGTAHFNSVDASLWSSTPRSSTSTPRRHGQLLARVAARDSRIIDSYHNGTRFGIHADSDGLITAGDYSTQ